MAESIPTEKPKKKNLREQLDYHIGEIKKSADSPHMIAFSFALGTFINILPLPFLGVWIALALVVIFKQINKYAIFFALIFWNYFTLAPINYISYSIGDAILVNTPPVTYQIVYLTEIIKFTKRMFVGSLIMAVPISILSYFGIRLLIVFYYKFKEYRKKRLENHKVLAGSDLPHP